ncbi:hypothetical protein DZB84_08435 [Bacillus sp. HNG]|uniref:hypothetical protein n=1 Tax=Bacillus sp. HNG TaxID=2293325 RepID=UPI000E2FDFB2|nr:hypothetical protein [Bacillus sp. HNG]RFB17867.1 hypothetical protein DZB84_08435 [Bacillus sp. HNG]
MTLFLMVGILLMILVGVNRNKLVTSIGLNNGLVKKLSSYEWFQNPWLSGLFLFVLNAILFGSTLLILFLLGFLTIPYIHLLVMFGAVIVSLVAWIILLHAWTGDKKGRILRGFIGSSFYLLLTLIFTYMIVTLEPQFPGHDTFMAFIGLVMAITVTLVAFITCFLFTGLFERKEMH